MSEFDFLGDVDSNGGRIRLLKKCVFKDRSGNVVKVLEIGDTLTFTAKITFHMGGGYYACAPGGIYFDEAEEV